MEDNIFLKAYGHVGGSYLSLIKMYRRMSFRVFAVDSHEHKGFTVQNLRTFRINDLELQGIDFVLMYTTVGSLLNWCVKKTTTKDVSQALEFCPHQPVRHHLGVFFVL